MLNPTLLQPGDTLILRDGTRKAFEHLTSSSIIAAGADLPFTWWHNGSRESGAIKTPLDIVAVERAGKIVQGELPQTKADHAAKLRQLRADGKSTGSMEDMENLQEAPAADEAAVEAAVEALTLVRLGPDHDGHHALAGITEKQSRAILAAIRADPWKFVKRPVVKLPNMIPRMPVKAWAVSFSQYGHEMYFKRMRDSVIKTIKAAGCGVEIEQ